MRLTEPSQGEGSGGRVPRVTGAGAMARAPVDTMASSAGGQQWVSVQPGLQPVRSWSPA